MLEDDSEDEDGNIKITDDFEEVDGDQEDEEQDEWSSPSFPFIGLRDFDWRPFMRDSDLMEFN